MMTMWEAISFSVVEFICNSDKHHTSSTLLYSS